MADLQDVSQKKSNRGCWIVGIILCIVMVLLLCGGCVALALLLPAGSSTSTSANETIIREGSEARIALIHIDGVIAEEDSSSSLLSMSGVTADQVRKELTTAMDDDTVKGVLLKMNSPGGEVVASDLIYRKVLEVRDVKPVVTWMSGMGASGGYYIASASDEIIAHPDTLTGSIGVIMELTNIQGLYDKLGIETRVFKSGQFKDESGAFDDDPNGEADGILQGLVDASYEHFISAVAVGRAMDVEDIRPLADGRIYTGAQAVEHGLIDATGDMDDAIEELETLAGQSDMTIIEYGSGGFWDTLFEYESAVLGNLGVQLPQEHLGAQMYYLLDL